MTKDNIVTTGGNFIHVLICVHNVNCAIQVAIAIGSQNQYLPSLNFVSSFPGHLTIQFCLQLKYIMQLPRTRERQKNYELLKGLA